MSSRLMPILTRLRACSDAIAWCGERTLAEAWSECPRGDWMLWLAARARVDRRLVVLAACDCAEQAQPHWNEHTAAASGHALTTARAWARADAAYAYAAAADAAYAAAASAYAYAADAAYAYAAAAAYAYAAAADAAYAAASSADAADARAASLETSAHLVRARIPLDVIAGALEVQP